MTFEEYQKAAYSTCTPECFSQKYLYWGLISEIGELAGKEAKLVRGDNITDEAIMGELGDIAWFIAVWGLFRKQELYPAFVELIPKPIEGLLHMALSKASTSILLAYLVKICAGYGFNIQDVMAANIQKLASRKQRGVIQGEGDNR